MAGTTDGSGDVPNRRPTALTRLDALVGEWEVAVEHPSAPSGIAIIGLGASPEAFTQHYHDSRGVARVYEMTLDGVWKLRREAPGFWQRYTGAFSHDGSAITGAWEQSSDGVEWKHDFELTYTKVA